MNQCSECKQPYDALSYDGKPRLHDACKREILATNLELLRHKHALPTPPRLRNFWQCDLAAQAKLAKDAHLHTSAMRRGGTAQGKDK